MIKAYSEVCGGAWRYMLACPLLFCVPVLIEFIQHVIEMRIGMYESIAAAQAVESHGARLGWGLVKTASLVLALYWTARFLVLGKEATTRPDPAAMRLFVWVMAWTLGWTALGLWGGDGMRAIGLGGAVMATGFTAFGLTLLLDILLAPWKVGSALGDPTVGFLGSIRRVGWNFWWGLLLSFMVVLPPMVAHYALSFLAMGRPEWLAWLLLALDSLVVGFLAALMAAVTVAIARRAGDRAGRPLAAA